MNPDAEFERVLDAALDRLAAGEAQATVLADYAAHAGALAPLLAAAHAARQSLGGPVPTPNLARGRRRFLASAQPPPTGRLVAWRPALVLLALSVILLVGAGAASAQALPGEPLYPVKRAVEAVQLALTFDPAARDHLSAALAARRRAEAARVLDLRREATLTFTGVVEAVRPRRLIISGLPVLTDNAADYAPGAVLAVEARATRTGELVATRLTRLVASVSPPAPPTVTPAATRTQRPSPTPSPSAPRATQTVRAAFTASPTTERPVTGLPSATLLPSATTTARAGVASPATPAPPTERPPDLTPPLTATPSARPSQRPPRGP